VLFLLGFLERITMESVTPWSTKAIFLIGPILLRSSILAAVCLTLAAAALAEKLDADLVPPDITLPSQNARSAAVSTTSAITPGLPGAAGLAGHVQVDQAAVPGMGSTMAPPQQTVGKTMFKLVEKPDANKPDPIAVIDTSKGVIKIRLFRQLAPITVANFIDIASKGFYNGLTFHRYEPGFCIQGGCPRGDGTGDYVDPVTHQLRYIPLEVSTQLRHNAAGVVAMARAGQPDSGSCQFYFTLAPKAQLDMHYAVFGGVLSGMEAVQALRKGDKINSISVQEAQ
jgi:cyclophilin family peptidyl-prolyl cis-trans isomerase